MWEQVISFGQIEAYKPVTIEPSPWRYTEEFNPPFLGGNFALSGLNRKVLWRCTCSDPEYSTMREPGLLVFPGGKRYHSKKVKSAKNRGGVP